MNSISISAIFFTISNKIKDNINYRPRCENCGWGGKTPLEQPNIEDGIIIHWCPKCHNKLKVEHL